MVDCAFRTIRKTSISHECFRGSLLVLDSTVIYSIDVVFSSALQEMNETPILVIGILQVYVCDPIAQSKKALPAIPLEQVPCQS